MKAFYNYKIFPLLCLMVCSVSFTRGADLIVASGQTYTIAAGQAQSFGNVSISGNLVMQDNATLTLTGNLVLLSSTGTMTLQSKGTVSVQGTAFIHQGCTLAINQNSNLTFNGLEVDGGIVQMNGSSRLTVNTNPIVFIQGGAFTVDGGSYVQSTGNDQGLGMGFYTGSSFTIDHSSKVEISGGYFEQNQGPIVKIQNSSIMLARGNVSVAQSSFSVASGGVLELYGDAIVDAFGTLTFGSGTEMRLFGGNQTVNTIPAFDNLTLGGSGEKLLYGPVQINNKLDLGSEILIMNNTAITIANPASDAIRQTSGYIISGPLKRAVNAQSLNKIYLFPVGINGVYRPVQIRPAGTGSGNYVVEYRNEGANRLNNKIDQMLAINSAYYHRIYREGSTSPADLTIFYQDQATAQAAAEGPFNRIAYWNSSISRWDFLNGLSGTIPAAPLLGITSRNVSFSTSNNLNPGSNLFVLAKADEKPFIPNSYGVVKRQLDGGFYIAIQDTVRFRFEEEYSTQNTPLKYTVYNKSHVPVSAINTALSESAGDNRFKIYVASLAIGEYGILEVQNTKGEKWYLKFKRKEF